MIVAPRLRLSLSARSTTGSKTDDVHLANFTSRLLPGIFVQEQRGASDPIDTIARASSYLACDRYVLDKRDGKRQGICRQASMSPSRVASCQDVVCRQDFPRVR